MGYRVYSSGKITNYDGEEICVSSLAQEFVDETNAGGEVQISDILEILESHGLLKCKNCRPKKKLKPRPVKKISASERKRIFSIVRKIS